jgi:heme A synthase
MALLNLHLHLHCIDPISSRLHFLHRLLMLVYFYTLLLTAYCELHYDRPKTAETSAIRVS